MLATLQLPFSTEKINRRFACRDYIYFWSRSRLPSQQWTASVDASEIGCDHSRVLCAARPLCIFGTEEVHGLPSPYAGLSSSEPSLQYSAFNIAWRRTLHCSQALEQCTFYSFVFRFTPRSPVLASADYGILTLRAPAEDLRSSISRSGSAYSGVLQTFPNLRCKSDVACTYIV